MSRRLSIDLFAGCGGLSLGLHRAGWEGLFAAERDAMAFSTLAANGVAEDAPFRSYRAWPAWLPRAPHDVVSLVQDPGYRAGLASLRGAVDLVAGGPPCQGFSAGGKRDGRDPRNALAFRMLDVVEAVMPRAVLVENVEGIEQHFKPTASEVEGPVAGGVLARLASLGYGATVVVVGAHRFGVPQSRRRVVIVAFLGMGATVHGEVRDALSRAASDVRRAHGLGPDEPTTVGEALDDLDGDVARRDGDARHARGGYAEPRSAFARSMRLGLPDGAVPNSHRMPNHNEATMEVFRSAHATQPPGRLAKSFLVAHGLRKDRKVLLGADLVSPTVTTHPDDFIHHRRPRVVTVREMARLQSFPDAFRFSGRYFVNGDDRGTIVPRCCQVGNAVPPLLGEGLGRAVAAVLDRAARGARPPA